LLQPVTALPFLHFYRGSAAVTVLGVYYVAPLSTVATVLKNRDSSSLYWPLSLMNVINGCLWFAYGLAILDYFIFVPK
jgi:solute carrier family 50 protein (sugar transporter)